MKKTLILLSFILAAVASFSFKSVVGKMPTSNVDTFINKQSVGAATTLYYSKGGIQGDSALILPKNSFSDTTTANFSRAAGYQGSLIMTSSGGYKVWYRTLNPNIWNQLATGSIPSNFNPIAGYGIILTGSYPNITFTVDTANIVSKTYFNNIGVKYSDTAAMLANRLKISDTTTMLSSYARSGSVPAQFNLSVNAPIAKSGTYPNITVLADTGRAVAELVTGGSLNKVRDSLQANITAAISGVSSFSFTNANGISGTVTNPTSTPNLTLSLGNITPTSVSASGGITATNFYGNGATLSGIERYTDTAALVAPYLRKSDTASMLANRLKISDTASMLSHYVNKYDSVYFIQNVAITSSYRQNANIKLNGSINTLDSVYGGKIIRRNSTDDSVLLGGGGVAAWASKLSVSDSLSGGYTTWKLTKKKVDSLGAIIGTKGKGTVTSVGLSLPSIISVSNSPITSSGTIVGTLANQTANTVFAGATTGSPAQPTFRALVAADLPASYLPISDTASMLSGYNLQRVTNLGNTTTNSITVNGLTSNDNINLSSRKTLNWGTGLEIIANSTTQAIAFDVKNNEFMRIDSSRQLLINKNTATGDSTIKMSTFGNADYTRNKPNYISFKNTTQVGRGLIKTYVGQLGNPEANLSHNMDYSTQVHKFDDSTRTASWIALASEGFFVQYAPPGSNQGDIWANGGYKYWISSDSIGHWGFNTTNAAPVGDGILYVNRYNNQPSISGNDTLVLEGGRLKGSAGNIYLNRYNTGGLFLNNGGGSVRIVPTTYSSGGYDLLVRNQGDSSIQKISSSSFGTVSSVATNNGSGITGGTITNTGTISADTSSVLSTKANVTASLLGYLPLTASSSKPLTGDLYIGDGSSNRSAYLNRSTTSNFTDLKWRTGGNLNWSLGLGETTTGTDMELYNSGTSSNAFKISYLTNGITFGNTLGINGVNDNIKSGTYTPTLTGVANTSSTTAYVCQYMRVGNTVTVSGLIQITPYASSTITTISVSLPISSNFSASSNAGGTGGGITSSVFHTGAISANGGGTTVALSYVSTQNAFSDDFQFSFTYQIL